MEEKLQRLIALRRRTLATLTEQMKKIETRSDAQNLQDMKDMMDIDFVQSLKFNSLNKQVGDLLSEDEKMCDHDNWFGPKMKARKDFIKTPKNWITEVHEATEKETVQLENYNVIDETQEAV